jgi:hypothetical protein
MKRDVDARNKAGVGRRRNITNENALIRAECKVKEY